MNQSTDNLTKLFGLLFLGNLIATFLFIVLLLNDMLVFNVWGLVVLLASCISLFALAMNWIVLTNSNVQEKDPRCEAKPQPKLSVYLSNALVLASGLVACGVMFYAVLSNDSPGAIKWNASQLAEGLARLAGVTSGTMLACLFFAFLCWLIQQDRWRANPINQMHRADRAKLRRKLARERAEANRIAQLNKPDFDTRLNQFVANVETDGEHPMQAEDEPFVSRAKFWQRNDVYERTLPKPIAFIRRILLRISKAVHGA